MLWHEVGQVIGKVAPLLGSTFGVAGATVGALVAKLLGVDNDPITVAGALSNSQALEQLRALETQIANNLQTEVAQLQTINTTMQQELNSKRWYDHWRSAWGWSSAAAFLGVNAALIYGFLFRPNLAASLLGNFSALSQLFIVPMVILGTVAWRNAQGFSVFGNKIGLKK